MLHLYSRSRGIRQLSYEIIYTKLLTPLNEKYMVLSAYLDNNN